ncbi:MAG: YuiA family protein [Anaerobacillus sp.]
MGKVKLGANDCPYCAGKGYFQLLLGGSETCECCQGTGEKAKGEQEKCTL